MSYNGKREGKERDRHREAERGRQGWRHRERKNGREEKREITEKW